jgi:exodeoxyribonuclease-3
VRVASWNVNGLRARLDFLLHWLRECEPDVVGLQELKLTDDLFPHEALRSAGYHAASHGQKSWNGVAILSRDELRVTQKGLPGQEDFGARLLTAELSGLSFTTVYCPNGKHLGHADFPRKLAWFDALATHLSERPGAGRASVLCGDFNVCPGPIDSWDEEGKRGSIFHTEEERERFRALLERGYLDTYRQLHPDGQAFSWWDYRGGAFHRGRGLRIDLLLATGELMERVRAAGIDREYRKKQMGLTPSDHAPVWAEIA